MQGPGTSCYNSWLVFLLYCAVEAKFKESPLILLSTGGGVRA